MRSKRGDRAYFFGQRCSVGARVVGLGTGGVAGDVTINRLVLLAFAVPLGCLALLSSLALLGILTLGGALHLVGKIRALCMVVSTKMNPRPSLSH